MFTRLVTCALIHPHIISSNRQLHTRSPMYSHSDSQSHPLTVPPPHSPTPSQSHPLTVPPPHSPTPSQSHPLTVPPPHSPTPSQSHPLTVPPPHSPTPSQSHPLTVPPPHSPTPSQSHPLTVPPPHSPTPSQSHPLTVPPPHSPTPSQSHPLTVPPPHSPTPSPYNTSTSLSSLTLMELLSPPHTALPTLALTPVAMVTGSRAGAPLCVPPAAPKGVQAPVEVRRRAPRVLPPQRPGEGTQRTPELLPNGIALPIQVGLLSSVPTVALFHTWVCVRPCFYYFNNIDVILW